MTYPSTFSSFNRPTANDKLNSPSHSDLHNTVSSAVGQIEQFIGLSTSSAVGSLTYDVRSPDSNGGGHVQTANKGGTGQTSYTKGDLLVASSTSVLSKLAIGSDAQVLSADSSQATGVKWVSNTTQPKVYVSGSVITANSGTETSILNATIAGSTLGTNNAVRATVFIDDMTAGGPTDSFVLKAIYGTTSIVTIFSSLYGSPLRGSFQLDLIGANTPTNQRMIFRNNVVSASMLVGSILTYGGYNTIKSSTIGENSSADKTLGMVVSWTGGTMTVNGAIVEKIT